MSEYKWEQVTEAGQAWWINDQLGNVVKSGEQYISILPKAIKLGPFNSLEEAKQVLESTENKKALEQMLDAFNQQLIDLCKSVSK